MVVEGGCVWVVFCVVCVDGGDVVDWLGDVVGGWVFGDVGWWCVIFGVGVG